MADRVWKIADLTDEQLAKLQAAEPTLGSINLLAFEPVGLKTASLTHSQIECLQGLEQILGVALVAYQK